MQSGVSISKMAVVVMEIYIMWKIERFSKMNYVEMLLGMLRLAIHVWNIQNGGHCQIHSTNMNILKFALDEFGYLLDIFDI